MSSTANPMTSKAGLIVNFYGRRLDDPNEMLTLQQRVGERLHLTTANTDLQDMSDPNQRIFLSRFDPPLAHDTTIVQLAISECDANEPDDAQNVWQKMQRKWQTAELSRLLNEMASRTNKDGQSIFWGYSLIYHAALATGVSLEEKRKSELLRLAHRPDRTPWKRAEPLAQTEIKGTQLWLMDIPSEGNGAEAATVYMALSPLEKEDEMINKVLYGRGAALLMPDLIAHKGYNQKRQYVGDPKKAHESPRTVYKTRIDDLRELIGPFLGFQLPNKAHSDNPKELGKLKFVYAQLLYATSILDEPRLSLAQQLENYAWWKDKLGSGDLGSYHYKQMQTAYRELELLIDKGQRMLEAAGTAIDMEQTEQNQKQEQRDNLIAVLLAVLGIALALSQIVDATAAGAVIEIFQTYQNGSMLSVESSKRLLELGVQFIPLLLIGVVASVWAYRRWR